MKLFIKNQYKLPAEDDISDGKTHAAIQTGHALFELGKGCEDAEELRRLTDIIDTLNVNIAPDDNHS